MKELVENNTLLSHLFMETIHQTSWFEKMPEKRKKMTEKQIENETIDIKLTIAGEEVDVREFFTHVENQLNKMVRKKAEGIVKERTSERMEEITDKIREMQEVVESEAESINWGEVDCSKSMFEK